MHYIFLDSFERERKREKSDLLSCCDSDDAEGKRVSARDMTLEETIPGQKKKKKKRIPIKKKLDFSLRNNILSPFRRIFGRYMLTLKLFLSYFG